MELYRWSENGEAIPSAYARKKYARMKRSAELGLWGSNPDAVFCITLTTAFGAVNDSGKKNNGRSKNSIEEFLQDNRTLRFKFKKAGYPYDDWMCFELTPLNHLLHAHGFWRFQEPQDVKVILPMMSEVWGKYHKSPIVDCRPMWDTKGAVGYDVKHAVKNAISEQFLPMRVVKSKGWYPEGWKLAVRANVMWALEKRDWLLEDHEFYEESAVDREYVYQKWEVVNDNLRRWCDGEEIYLEMKHLAVLIQGNKYYEGVIENDDST